MIKCILSCQNTKQTIELNLTDCLVDTSSVDFSKCTTVLEDGNYDIYFSSDEYCGSNIKSITVCVNGEHIGHIDFNADSPTLKGKINYKEDIFAKQPFLLHYDLVVLSFVISFADESASEYFSEYLLCVSKNQTDTTNIQNMLKELIAFDDSQISEWMFSNNNHNTNISLYEGKWNKHAYKSLSSYIQLLDQVITGYKNNYAYFKAQGKHTIIQSSILVPYEKVKKISRNSINWTMQNADQLAEIPYISGIQFLGKNYLPYRIKTDSSKKSWNVYENRVIISFLYTVLLNAKQIFAEFDRDILNEERIISKIHGKFPKAYHAPVITIKSLQISFGRILLKKLDQSIKSLQYLYKQYGLLFDIQVSIISKSPRKTSTFCEIKPYVQIFEIITRWFDYGEYSLQKEQLILQIKTIDKLFEYYCLIQLLKLLSDNGFKKANVTQPAYNYSYTLQNNNYYQNETDIANTYLLSKNNILLTLYYQPVISSVGFENNLTLFRTTKPYQCSGGSDKTPLSDYYTPDFILKFSSSEHDEEYVILDSKFSSRDNIKKHSLPDIIHKYSCEFCAAANIPAPKMVWVLQGRVKRGENIIWKYHNSPLISAYKPITSFGIVSINTYNENKYRFWNEIRNNISLL